MKFLFSTLAEYQTRFWLEVGLRLRSRGHKVAFLSFDDRSSEMLKKADLKVYEAKVSFDQTHVTELDRVIADFSVSDLNYWFGHERFAFGISNSHELKKKLVGALIAADAACRDFKSLESERLVMIQELGGFLSVIGSFFASRQHDIEHWFIEPSFFRGRMFFLKNSFSAPQVNFKDDVSPSKEMLDYLEDTLARCAIVVPLKDKHQYTTARKKVVNLRNAKRLFEKLLDKFAFGKHQEFGYIGHHVRTHLRLIYNSFHLRKLYTPLQELHQFVYYPLHVPGDMALTLRTPHLLDQLALIDYLCRTVPHTHIVAIKEHPAMVGAMDQARLRALLQRYDNLVLLPPTTNNYKVLMECAAVVSINSKSGAEAALLGKPVLVLGDAFYRDSPLVSALEKTEELPARLQELLQPSRSPHTQEKIHQYFACVWNQSSPGELYVNNDTNLALFVESLCAV